VFSRDQPDPSVFSDGVGRGKVLQQDSSSEHFVSLGAPRTFQGGLEGIGGVKHLNWHRSQMYARFKRFLSLLKKYHIKKMFNYFIETFLQ
jgi:hypothetical protein